MVSTDEGAVSRIDAPPLVKTLSTTSSAVTAEELRSLDFAGRSPSLLLGFVSPHADFATTARSLAAWVAPDTRLVLISTSGELCSSADGRLYCPAGASRDGLVLQAFSRDLIREVDVHAIPLHNEDIRSGDVRLSREQRVAEIEHDLSAVTPAFPLDFRDTVALTFIDGVSASEGYFMEAVYASGRFPLLFIGGSAGGKLDFSRTEIFAGSACRIDHAVVILIKLAPGKRYGVFKSQNFRPLAAAFTVLDADPVRRTVTSVIDPETLEVSGFIDAVCRKMGCSPNELEAKFVAHTFAIDIDGEMFVRSVARIDHAADRVEFYCGVNAGDVLHLVEATGFVERTEADYRNFLKGKPTPVGGLLNDCILRRLNNAAQLDRMNVFDDCPVAGFSTFGELFGIEINQTLSALFFFEDDPVNGFRDEWIDNFPIHYARFQLYFQKARHTRLSVLNRLRQRLIQNLITHTDDEALSGETVNRIGSCAEPVATDDVGLIAGTAVELHTAFRKATREREAVREALFRREMELRFAEERRVAAEARANLEAQLQHARRLEALGRMAGGLAHEINNMLQPIIGLCDMIRCDFPSESDGHANLSLVIDAARRIEGITSQVQLFGRSMSGDRHPISLPAVLRDAIDILRLLPPPRVEIRVVVGAEDIVIEADETQIVQILMNLVHNAVDAVDAVGDEPGVIEIGLERSETDPALGAAAVLSVRDTGRGMDTETRERMFDPFFTTKPVGMGTGMGLSVVHGLVESWGGAIDVESVVDQGTTVRIRLPTSTTTEASQELGSGI